MEDEEGLLKTREVLPAQYQNIFGHDSFNHMQSLLVNQALNTNMNMVVAAPTGCGKTVIHELAIVRLMMKYSAKNMKIVYVAPNKALCQQKVEEWSLKFGPFGLSVLEVTGDIEFKYCLQMVAKATVIVTTPEKWDSLTRSWRDHVFLLGAIDLLLIDEVHHLGEDRGSTLEIVVVRMRLLNSTCIARKKQHGNGSDTREGMRIIALSATLPNLSDIGEWIHCDPSAVHYFDESFRPVPLTIHTLGLGSLTNPFLFERSLDDKVAEVIQRYSEDKQTLIFCSSKKNTESLATLLAKQLGVHKPTQRITQAGDGSRLASLQDTQLRHLAQVGYAYHHSGLSADDRAAIEQLYLSGYISVLCSTSTLAHGVNLPAHLVVIKGTNCWRGGSRGYEKMNRSEIIQMLGRAGRPGFDTQGVAVIMTSAQDREHYAAISLSAEVVESTLQSMLTEAICAEVSQNVICSLQDCLDWIKSTYFYVRVKVNPTKYGFPGDASDEQRASLLAGICNSALNKLFESKIIDVSSPIGESVSSFTTPVPVAVQSKPETHIMSRNMIRFDTMKMLVSLPAAYSLPQLLRDFSTSIELGKPVRKLEKRILNDMLKSLRFPLRAAGQSQSTTRVQEPWQKAFVLMQAAVARLDLKDFSLRVEQSEIVECGLRVLSALAELCRTKGAGPLLENTLLLDRALRVRCWDYNYGSVFTQCQGLTDNVRNGLTLNCVRTENDLEGCTVSKVQAMARCSVSEARSMLHFANILRLSKLSMKVVIAPDNTRLTVTLKSVVPSESTAAPPLPLDQIVSYQLLCYDTATTSLLLYRRIDAASVHQPNNIFSVAIPVTSREIRCCLLGNVVGNDVCRAFTNSSSGETIIAPKPAPVVTDLSAKYNKGSSNGGKKTPAALAKTVPITTPSTQSSVIPAAQTQLRIPYQPIAKARQVGISALAEVPVTPPLSSEYNPSSSDASAKIDKQSPGTLPTVEGSSTIDFEALLKMLECPATPPVDQSVREFLNSQEILLPTPPPSPSPIPTVTLDAVPQAMEKLENFQPRVTVMRQPVPPQQSSIPPIHVLVTEVIRQPMNVHASGSAVIPACVSRDLSLLRSKASEMGFTQSTNVKRIRSSGFAQLQQQQPATQQQSISASMTSQSLPSTHYSPPRVSHHEDPRPYRNGTNGSPGRPFFNVVSVDERHSAFDVDRYLSNVDGYLSKRLPPVQPAEKQQHSVTSVHVDKIGLQSSVATSRQPILKPVEKKKKKCTNEDLFDACF